jgi:uncharacterized heparinase superfamily protein
LNLAGAVAGDRGPEGCRLTADQGRALAEAATAWRETVQRMRVWLAALCHPDGEIALFNDAAFGLAPTPVELDAYARRLGLGEIAPAAQGVTRLEPSGYVRLALGPAVALLDCAPIGPDYLPGHAHADTLSFELSLWGRRLLVDSGTDRYGEGPERLRQRGTAAHNTVQIDGADSSEVWGGFRVARRAYPLDLQVGETPEAVTVTCAHDGYRRLPGHPVHRRRWTLTQGGLVIHDRIEGPFGSAVARLHLHPEVRVEIDPDQAAGSFLIGTDRVGWRIHGDGRARRVHSSYHPRFGSGEPSVCLELDFAGPTLETRLSWAQTASATAPS